MKAILGKSEVNVVNIVLNVTFPPLLTGTSKAVTERLKTQKNFLMG